VSNRKRITKEESTVLLKSKRRCCLCFHFADELNEKAGQIAHIDQNPSNSLEDNLVFLCLKHHDQYDTQTSQSKGLTPAEVRDARTRLYEHLTVSPDSESSKTKPFDAELSRFALLFIFFLVITTSLIAVCIYTLGFTLGFFVATALLLVAYQVLKLLR